ncbi:MULTISPECIES: acyl carrier protein [unclassified Streptomyces]|uniref:acyl carrier protein n=1 Tax=unclassified Streptomyces TaxID=2593676 RepID=UPI00225C18AB|nr:MULTISPECIES: acyl carrier protein [unclassified Streptomyces]MCX4883661.1 acyl carrier protein [Streptomyces sp. NBC_00847]MCX5423760.1 acyl carrier protein [Streptomyces sp. NBC_00078]
MSTRTMTRRQVRSWLVGRVAEHLKVAPETVSPQAVFSELGLSSVQAVELTAELEDFSGLKIPPTMVYEYPTIDDVAAYVAGQ